jgi:hypothetical protein
MTDPAPVGTEGSSEVIPAAKNLDLQVVVADTGNQPERNLTVTAAITPALFGPTQQVREFADLAAGQSKTVRLGGLRAQVGVVTALTVAVSSVAGEADTTQSTKTVAFVMR